MINPKTADSLRSLRAAREALEEVQALVKLREEEYRAAKDAERPAEPGPDSYVRILVTYPGGRRTYTYLAYRPEDTRNGDAVWFITGRQGTSYWDDFIKELSKRAATVEAHELVFPANA